MLYLIFLRVNQGWLLWKRTIQINLCERKRQRGSDEVVYLKLFYFVVEHCKAENRATHGQVKAVKRLCKARYPSDDNK